MHIYFAGVGGMGLGPLALIAREAGYEVTGSDMARSPMTDQLAQAGITIIIGQSGKELEEVHAARPIDWLVMTASLPPGHPEVVFAESNGIRVTKRDELINYLITSNQRRLIAVSGTHGKTTTTAMLVWLFREFAVPLSYSIGAGVGFGPSGHFDREAEYFVYEADEYDRNFLHFHPSASVITSVDYDHPDTYPTVGEYKDAFREFIKQSEHTFLWERDAADLHLRQSRRRTIIEDTLCAQKTTVRLAGEHNRHNAQLAMSCFSQLYPEFTFENLSAAINNFPGTMRHFEKLADNLYSDYAHHPTEIAATLQLAHEIAQHVVVIYQPHQNRRQHEIQAMYKDCFAGAERIYWLPTYVTREDPHQSVLSPADLIKNLADPPIAEPAEMNQVLIAKIREARKQHKLVLALGAGDVDPWLRKHLAAIVGTYPSAPISRNDVRDKKHTDSKS